MRQTADIRPERSDPMSDVLVSDDTIRNEPRKALKHQPKDFLVILEAV
jgi:hypothetical protein